MISTPIKPTAVATQRRKPTFSPRRKIDSAVTNNGETKLVADASAMGRNRKPEMKSSEDASNAMARISCRPGRRECKAYSGVPGSMAGTMISTNTRNLIQAISIDGNVDDRYFEVASDVPRNTVDKRMSAMPRNGRSARAGAVRATDFFSGRGNGALSGPAAADGGVTVKPGVQNLKYRIGGCLKNDSCVASATPENRQRICVIACGGLPRPQPHNIGRLRGLAPRGKALSSAAMSSLPSEISPAAALSAACC